MMPAVSVRPRPLSLVSSETGTALLPPLPRALLTGEAASLLEPAKLLRFPETLGEPRAELSSDRLASRREVAAALAEDNRRWGHPDADSLAQRLADPDCRVVVTGQQPGLFGGPLYALSKMIASVRWAEQIQHNGRPAVAVFWSATEDHDYREVTAVEVLCRGEPRRFGLGADPEPLRPVGERRVDEKMPALIEELRGVDDRLAWHRALDLAADCYSPGVTLGEGFARLMIALLGEKAPLILDARQPTLKRAQVPYLRRVVERRHEITEACAARDNAITSAGFSLQVIPQPDSSPLFVVEDGERRRVLWTDSDSWSLRGLEDQQPISTLLDRIADDPESVSPGVLCRPVVQDGVLGTDLLLLGPGELSYFTQVAPLYPWLEVEPPRVALRPQVAVLAPRHLAWMHDLAVEGIDPEWLVASEAALERRLAQSHGEDLVGTCHQDLRQRFDEISAAVLALDGNLERPLAKTRQQIQRAMATLAGKVSAAAARQDEVRHRRIETVRESLLPGGRLQERRLNSLWLLGRFGAELAPAIAAQLGLEDDVLHIVGVEPSP